MLKYNEYMHKDIKKKIIIVGGGAGGLELAAKLCNKFKRNQSIEISLIDKNLKHVWKPLFHEIAAGTFASYNEEIDYISYAYETGFTFFLGEVKKINRADKSITIAPYHENEQLILPERQLTYDVLILAIGSKVNDFNIPGVTEHCLLLDSLSEAERCNQILLNYIIGSTQNNIKKFNISIVGGGATGVELAAELNYVLTETHHYKNNPAHKNTYNFQVTVIEAADRLLNNLPTRISRSVDHYLKINNINILTDTQIKDVKENGLTATSGKFIEADMVIWAAGIKGNAGSILHDLEINKINQFIVTPTLQTSKDESIFAFGDCASCPQIHHDGAITFVPPRAQAAHQQANLLVKSISCYLYNKKLPVYHYQDYGSLISLSQHAVGNLMGKIAKSLFIEGILARFTYWLLYKKHLITLKGIRYIILNALSELFIKKHRSGIKLH